MVTTTFQRFLWPQLRCLISGDNLIIASILIIGDLAAGLRLGWVDASEKFGHAHPPNTKVKNVNTG